MNNREVIQTISQEILRAIRSSLKNLSGFDVTIQGKITSYDKEDGVYTVESKQNIYKIHSNLGLEINQIVTIVLPQNNASNAFIIPPHSVNKLVLSNPLLDSVDGICTWICTHNKNTFDVSCTVINTVTGDIINNAKINIQDYNTICITFNSASPITANQYRVIII